MRVLTVRQPWALHLVQSGKDVENRVRNLAGNYRGPVAIHAAKLADADALRRLPMHAPNDVPRVFEFGFIIGVVDITDVHHADTCRGTGDDRRRHEGVKATRDPGLADAWPQRFCSPWAEPDRHHLVLSNPRQLAEPVPHVGALGLRHLPDSVAAQLDQAQYLALDQNTGAAS